MFPWKVQLVTIGVEDVELNIPPPAPAVFPWKVQLVTVGFEEGNPVTVDGESSSLYDLRATGPPLRSLP